MQNYVYVVFHLGTGLVKIGRSQNPKSRYKSLETANIHLDGGFFIEAHIYVESLLHMYFDCYRFKNEWFIIKDLIPNKSECNKPLFFLEEKEDYKLYKENVVESFTSVVLSCNKYFHSLGIHSGDRIKVDYKKRVNKRDRLINNAWAFIHSELHPNKELKEEVCND